MRLSHERCLDNWCWSEGRSRWNHLPTMHMICTRIRSNCDEWARDSLGAAFDTLHGMDNTTTNQFWTFRTYFFHFVEYNTILLRVHLWFFASAQEIRISFDAKWNGNAKSKIEFYFPPEGVQVCFGILDFGWNWKQQSSYSLYHRFQSPKDNLTLITSLGHSWCDIARLLHNI